MAVRRARLMPVQDDKDRCDRCGRVIKAGEARIFVDIKYARRLRTDPRCTPLLRQMAGFREVME